MIRVRPAREADLDRLAQFWYERAALTPLPRGLSLRPDARAHWCASAQTWLTAPDWCVLVAEADDELAGFAAGRIVDGPPGFSPTEYGDIAAFALDGHAYHPGAGRALVDGLQGWFHERGVTRVCVTIPKPSAVEQAFWRALRGESWDETLWWTW
ncbi:MAG: GNAT family N-acetyltransferase [Anaerolineae bacterium]|nr:GNAT family N-acetyltransferase [Anaerolineae bacterium]